MGRLTTLRPRLPVLKTGRMPMHTMAEHRRLRGSEWETLRRQVLHRDRGLCVPCHQAGAVTVAREVDHVVPQWEGGTDDPSNLQSICRKCHAEKTAQEARRRAGGV